MVAQAIAKGLTALAARGGKESGKAVAKEAGEAVAKQADMPSGLRSVYEQPAFHSTRNIEDIIDVDEIRFINKKPEADIGFHVGLTPLAANQRIIQNDIRDAYLETLSRENISKDNYKQALDELEKQYEDSSNLLLKLNDSVNPVRVPDVSNFKNPLNWAESIAISKKDFPDQFDLSLVTIPKTNDFEHLIIKHKGDELLVMPEYLRDMLKRDGKIDKEYIEDLVKLIYDFKDKTLKKYASTSSKKRFNTQESVQDRRTWFEELKKVNKKHGYDSFIYKNKYEGIDKTIEIDKKRLGPVTSEKNIRREDAEDSLMLMYPEQVKYTTASKFDPKSPKLSMKKGGSVIERNPYNYPPRSI
tara:strand:- start:14 stop:1087 length:1074 start_codon:yes stop_codon:yes gene_type:complete